MSVSTRSCPFVIGRHIWRLPWLSTSVSALPWSRRSIRAASISNASPITRSNAFSAAAGPRPCSARRARGPSVGALERERVASALVAMGLPAGRLVEGVIASSIEEAVYSTGQALRRGSHAVLLAPPFYFRQVPDDAVFAWYQAVFRALGRDLRDIILYHIPSMTGVALSPAVIRRLVQSFPGAIRGIKDSSGDADATFALIDAFPDLDVLVGDETYLGRACAAGAAGSICGLANMAPEAAIALAEKGEDDPRVVRLVREIVSHPIVPHGEGPGGSCPQRPGLGDRTAAAPHPRRVNDGTGQGAARRIAAARRDGRMSTARRAPRSEVTLRERAYDAFTHHLLRSDIKPGQFMSQRELVLLTGQPLGAIRELIPRLEAEGLIITVPQRGLQILPLDINLIRNAFQFRLILEREAIVAFIQTAGSAGSRRSSAPTAASSKRRDGGVTLEPRRDGPTGRPGIPRRPDRRTQQRHHLEGLSRELDQGAPDPAERDEPRRGPGHPGHARAPRDHRSHQGPRRRGGRQMRDGAHHERPRPRAPAGVIAR